MKNRTTFKSAASGKKSFRRAFILFIIYLMLPGCITNMDRCDIINGRCFKKTAHTWYTTAYGDETQKQQDNPTTIAVNTDKNNAANGGYTTTAIKNNMPAANNADADPLQFMLADSHIDTHDAGEEEKIMRIKFHALMRIAIMMLLIVLII